MVIGLTGGIASGKSTISSILKELGAYIVDADIIARSVVQKDEKAYNEIVQNFGKEILMSNGEINRKKLGHMVFSDSEKLELLNHITHPEIIKRVKKKVEEYKHIGAKVIVIDAAILIEVGLDSYCDSIWLVTVDLETQIRRLMERDKCAYMDALNRINSQYTNEKKSQFADVIIDNNKPIKEVETKVKELWNIIIQRGEAVEI